MLKVFKDRPHDDTELKKFADNLRETDKKEINLLYNTSDYLKCLKYSIKASYKHFSYYDLQNSFIGLGGGVKDANNNIVIWFVGTDELYSHKKDVFIHTRKVINTFLDETGEFVYNFISGLDKQYIKILKMNNVSFMYIRKKKGVSIYYFKKRK